MNYKKFLSIALLTLIALALVACAPANPVPADAEVPGFWRGVLHGLLIVINLIRICYYWLTSGETPIGIYATNGGIGYMIGFALGVLSNINGSAGTVRSRRRRG